MSSTASTAQLPEPQMRLSEPQKAPEPKILHFKGNQLMFLSLVKQISSKAPFEQLAFTDCHNITSEEFIKIFDDPNLNNATHLTFNSCVGVNDAVLTQLAVSKNLEKLEVLDLARCRWFTNKGLQDIFNSPIAEKIKELNLSKCDCVTDETLKSIAASQYLKNLTTLNLSKCYEITKDGIIALVNSVNVTSLTTLDLTQCWRIRDEALAAMATSTSFRSIEKLYLTGLNYITTAGIEKLVDSYSLNLSQLKNLSLANCFLLDDKAVFYIASSMAMGNLQELNLNHNAKITSQGIEHIFGSQTLPRLEALYINDIYLSPRADIAMICSQQLPKFKRLSFNTEKLKNSINSDDNEVNEMHYGPDASFPDEKIFNDAAMQGQKKVIIEKDFPYRLDLPVFKNIQILCISVPTMTDEMFQSLLLGSYQNSLTTVKLFNLKRLTEAGIKTLLCSTDLMEKVKSLELRKLRNLSNQCMREFSKNKVAKLTELRIQGDSTDIAEKPKLDASGLSALILSPVCKEVKTLELKELDLEEDILKYIALSDDMQLLQELILDRNFKDAKERTAKDQQKAFRIFFGKYSKLKSLRTLSLKECPALTNKAFEEIYKVYDNCPQNLSCLESIQVDPTDLFEPDVLKPIINSIPKTRISAISTPNLVFKNLTRNRHEFGYLFTHCSRNSQLLLIDLSNVQFLFDKHLSGLVEIEALSNLRTLKIKNMSTLHGDFLHDWAQAPQRFTNLQKLQLENLENLKSDGLEMFVKKADLTNLIKIEIRACILIGDSFLKSLASNESKVKRIHRLVLESLPAVTDAGLAEILTSKVSQSTRILQLKDLRNIYYPTLNTISQTNCLQELMNLKILNCNQIDSSKLISIFTSKHLNSLASFSFDNPIIPNEAFLKSFVETSLYNLVDFSLNFAGDFPRGGILDLLRGPNIRTKHIVLSQLVGSNLETIANDQLIELLIKADFVDICLSLNVRGKSDITIESVKNLLNSARNPEFILEKLTTNYGDLITDGLLELMGHWEIDRDDYMRVAKKVAKKKNRSESPVTRRSAISTTPIDPSTPTLGKFSLKVQEVSANNDPNIEAPKIINFLAHFPLDYCFTKLSKVTEKGIADIIKHLPIDLDVVMFMENHQEILNDKIFTELITKPRFKDVTSVSLKKFKGLTKKAYELIFQSNNNYFLNKVFTTDISEEFLLDSDLLSLIANSPELRQVEVVKASKKNFKLNCFDGLNEIFKSKFNDKIRKVILSDIFVMQEAFKSLAETTKLTNLKAITLTHAESENYTVEFKKFVASSNFSRITQLHIHKCQIKGELAMALESQNARNLEQLYIDHCENNHFFIEFSKLKNLDKLRHLKLKNVYVPLEFFASLKTSSLALDELTLDRVRFNTSIGNDEILALVGKMKHSKIKRLTVDGIKITTISIDAMSTSPVFSELQYLKISDIESRFQQRKMKKQVTQDSKGSFSKIPKPMANKMTLNEDLTLADFKKLIKADFIGSVKELKLKYRNLDDEWVEAIVKSNKLKQLESLEFHPECCVTSTGMSSIIDSRHEVFKKLKLTKFLGDNFKLIDDALLRFLCAKNKLHHLNEITVDTGKITSEGLAEMLNALDPANSNKKLDLIQFLVSVKDKVNDKVFEALSKESYATILKDSKLWEQNIFENVQEKTIQKFKIIFIDRENELNQQLREFPHLVDDDFIDTICKCSLLNNTLNHPENSINIKLDSNLHKKVTSKGLNALIKKMCANSFTVYHDWVLLDDHWRSLLSLETLELIANDRICKPEALDLVTELDFENNCYVSTNGYQHLMRLELRKFQEELHLEEKDKYLNEDTEDFLKRLNDNRFKLERTNRDDKIGECFLKIIVKCEQLKKINFRNKNFGDKFFRNLSIKLSKSNLHLLEEMNFSNNPRLTSTGLKYLYTAIVGNGAIKRINIRCDAELKPEINTIVDDGLYIFTKKRILELKKPGPTKIDGWFLMIIFYMIIAWPFALWQFYEDRIMESKKLAQVKTFLQILETPFRKLKTKKNKTHILPVTAMVLPNTEQVRKKAEIMLRNEMDDEIPAENFYFTEEIIELNDALAKNKWIFWVYLANFIVYYIVCIAVPILFQGDTCEAGLKTLGFVVYGIYAFVIFLFEVFLYKFMVDIVKDTKALYFGIVPFINLIISQTSKFDLFTDVVFIVNLYDCHLNGLAGVSTFFVVISVIFSIATTIATAISIYKGRDAHYSSNINRYAKLSLATEIHSIGHALDKFSTSNCVRYKNVYMSQIMVSAIGKFVLEDFPQFILQLVKIFGYSSGNANLVITVASTIMSLFLSFRTAMRARPSVCKPEQIEQLVQAGGKRPVAKTNSFEEEEGGEAEESPLNLKDRSSIHGPNEDKIDFLIKLQVSRFLKEQPDQGDLPDRTERRTSFDGNESRTPSLEHLKCVFEA